ncbi:VTC domain-containing protein [Konateibacter massiliensis]|uniref:VTC domain-containing protein n=1 Tax=Konateibacter massiliensis TaxID=2002841 RepID=UPI000C148D7F|nr:VTC domain-containing protein [Konateibacter massiliensis]
MKYTMYNEENNVIQYDEYDAIREKIQEKYKQEGIETVVRKVKFVENKYKTYPAQDIENKPSFSLCMRMDENRTYYLEKKSRQNGVTYKSFVNLEKEECEKILAQDIEWMKDNKKALLNEFYLYLTINHLKTATVMEYKRVVYDKPGKFCVVFNEEVKRAVDQSASLLDEAIQMFDCLSCDKVIMSYKKIIKIPRALNNILNISNEPSYELAFSL